MLLERLTGAGDEEQMPKDDPPLPPAEIALIARWIDEGVRETPSGPPAPAPWVAPLTLDRPAVPGAVWPGWQAPADRLVADYLRRHGQARADADRRRPVRPPRLPRSVGPAADARAAAGVPRRSRRRTSAPGWCGRCSPTAIATPSTGSRSGTTCCATRTASPTSPRTPAARASRRGCSPALRDNLPYDRFVAALIDPAKDDDPKGFVTGVNWRGETSAAVTPWMQAAQNTSQVFLGVNLKCASCHDSFVNKWKLKDAYGLAAYFSPGRHAADVSLRPAAGQAHRPRLPLPRLRAHAAIRTRSPTGAPPRPRRSPIRAWAGCRGRSSTASGSGCWGAASSPPSTRWTASRGARRCSTGWPPTSPGTSTTSST